MVRVTEQAKEELKRTLDRAPLESGKYLRLTTPPVWPGAGDFGIVIDAIDSGDHVVEFERQTVLLVDQDLMHRLPNAVLDFKTEAAGARFTLDVY